jgi:hypothetical protein
MLDPGIRILKTSEFPKYDPLTLDKTTLYRVEWAVDKHGPFVEYFPKDTYTAAARDLKLNALAREVK